MKKIVLSNDENTPTYFGDLFNGEFVGVTQNTGYLVCGLDETNAPIVYLVNEGVIIGCNHGVGFVENVEKSGLNVEFYAYILSENPFSLKLDETTLSEPNINSFIETKLKEIW